MGNKTILIIEDNEQNLKLLRIILQRANYQVLEATDAYKGIRLAHKHRPSLIVMDIQLPGMNGFNATQDIKGDAILKDIPVIAMTSFSKQENEEKAMAVGCSGYITKPFNTESFLDMVSQHVK